MGLALVAAAIAIAAIVVTSQPEPVIGVDGAIGLDAVANTRGEGSPPVPAPSAGLVVDVGGAVLRPGVYHLPDGARVADAIAAAGGYGPSADAALVDLQLNLAAVVRDGEKVRVPARGDALPVAGGGAPAGGAAGPGGADRGAANPGGALVNLNTADAAALDSLPGVGPATIAKIVAARDEQPFASVDDLLARKVVGAVTLEKLRPLVSVGP
jgi:competence protein ComEA